MIRTTKIITGSANKPILTDSRFIENGKPKPIIIFSHGFKGYKDWGAFNLMADYLAEAGFVFIKFNFSYNGGTMEDPIDFPDLEAFGLNNYSIEMNDLGLVIDAAVDGQLVDRSEINTKQITLMGHSRGGGISILKAAEDKRIAKLVTLAAVSDFSKRFPTGKALAEWKEEGVQFILNSRTKQRMPMYFQMYEDFIANKDRLNIPLAATRLNIPYFILHGTDDETVQSKEAQALDARCSKSTLMLVQNANHTFGMKHPWELGELSDPLVDVLDQIVTFCT
jgi:dienelactone hydrolase